MSVQSTKRSILSLSHLALVAIAQANYSYATDDWLCTDDAAQRRGNAIIACGVGIGNTEADAREDALEKAKKEFKGICDQSYDCNGHEIILSPLRNTCSPFSGGKVQCYRGFRYEISEKMKPAESPPPTSQTASGGKNDEASESLVDLPEQLWRIQLGLGYSGDSISNYNAASGFFCCGALYVALQRKLFWKLHFLVQYDFRSGTAQTSSQSGPLNEGTPNTSQNFATQTSGHVLAISFPVEFYRGWFVAPEVGRSVGSLVLTQRTYSSAGSGNWTGSNGSTSYQNNFVGAQVLYESPLLEVGKSNWGWYGSCGYRNYFNGTYPGNGAITVGGGISLVIP